MFSYFIVGLYCIDAIGAEVQGGTLDSDSPSIVCPILRPKSEQQGGVVPGPISELLVIGASLVWISGPSVRLVCSARPLL